MNPMSESSPAGGQSLQQYQALLNVCDSITRHADLAELCRDFAPRLRRVVPFDFITILLHDPAAQAMQLHVFEPGPTPSPRQGPDLTPLQSPGGRRTGWWAGRAGRPPCWA
jgi:hypothetical protein